MMNKIILVGSGEFTTAMEEIDRAELGGRGPIAIVPTAAGQEADWWKWVEMGRAHFDKLKIESVGIDVRSRSEANDEERMKDLRLASVVYFSGGDPGYLVQTIKDSKIWEEIKTKDVIVGSSAGAMLLGRWVLGNIYPVFEQGETKLEWVKAGGVVPYTIWPHYDYVQREEKQKWEWVKARMPKEVYQGSIGIDEDTAVIVKGDKDLKIMGKGKLTVFS